MQLKTIACVAEKEFTRFVDGYGMVVGAPESSLPKAKKPEVPVNVIPTFVAEGLIKEPKGFDADTEETEVPADDKAPA
jgi:hypothetical protein